MKIIKFIQKFLHKKDIKKEILEVISGLDISKFEFMIIKPGEILIKEVIE